MRALFVLSVSLVLAGAQPALAQPDEPGAGRIFEEPGVEPVEDLRAVPGPVEKPPSFRLELAFGLASPLVDPEVGEGYGGGLSLAWVRHRVGIEASVYFSALPYEGAPAQLGVSFYSGNVSLGPIIQLTRPGSRLMVTAELALGSYAAVPLMYTEPVWTLGISGGLTLAYRVARWFGFGVKLRYHLFNLAHLSGPEFRDPLQEVGVVDRFELPAYLAFYF